MTTYKQINEIKEQIESMGFNFDFDMKPDPIFYEDIAKTLSSKIKLPINELTEITERYFNWALSELKNNVKSYC